MLDNASQHLGHVVGRGQVQPDPDKVAAVQNWPEPKNVSELRSFLGMANYFRRFVQGYSKLAAPLHELLTKSARQSDAFTLTNRARAAFQGIRSALVLAPVLQLFDPGKMCEVVADASGEAIGAVLLQGGKPVAFESRKLNKHELNYSIGEKELLAVKHALTVWRHYLLHKRFKVVTDHRPNVTLQTLRSLEDASGRKARWAEFLQQYDKDWEYRPGRMNVADPLSRMPSAAKQLP